MTHSDNAAKLKLYEQFDAQGNPTTEEARVALAEFEAVNARIGERKDMNGAMDGWSGVPDPRVPPPKYKPTTSSGIQDTDAVGWDLKPDVNYIA